MLRIFTVTYDEKEEKSFYLDDPSLASQGKDKRPRVNLGFGGSDKYRCRCSNFKELSDQAKLDAIEATDLEKGFDDVKEWAAADFVFSAPECLSREFERGKDRRLFDAHFNAVQHCVNVIEERYAAISVVRNWQHELVSTGNIAVALLPHQRSKYGDPHLHTHAVVMNGTASADGSRHALCHWRLLEGISVGSLYRERLSANIQTLGYKVHETPDGFGF